MSPISSPLLDIVQKRLGLSSQAIAADEALTRELQAKLKDLGLYVGTVDGIYGRQTELANNRFCDQVFLNCANTNHYGPTWAKKLLATKGVPGGYVLTKDQCEHIFQNPIYPKELLDLNNCLSRFDVGQTKSRIRHFMAQIAHESGGLRWLKELASGWDYEGRSDLGNNHPGDGPRFKGAGVLQLTGRANYQALSDYLDDPRVMEGCDYVANTYPFTSAGYWWKQNDMNTLIDTGATVEQVTYRVNGGTNGLSDRLFRFRLAGEVI